MIEFESEQSDFTEDKFSLAGNTVSELSNAGHLDLGDLFLISQHDVEAKILYDVADVIINEKVPYVENPKIDPFHDQAKEKYVMPSQADIDKLAEATDKTVYVAGDDVVIHLSNQTINNIYIKTMYDEGISADMLAKWQYTTATKIHVILPPEPAAYADDKTYDYYFHFCWLNQIVYPMNSYDQWADKIYPKLKHCINATIYDSDLNVLSTYEFRNIEHEDCFSMIRNDDGINVLTKYKGIADLRQYEDKLKLAYTGNVTEIQSQLCSDFHRSYRETYDDFRYKVFYDISAGIPFGSMAWENQDEYALVKHLHDYSYVSVYPYYTEADANSNLYNLIGIVHLSSATADNQVSIWLPEIEEPIFFEDHLIGELKPVALDRGLLPAVDLDSKYFDGWVYCDGASYPRDDFPEAYEIFRYAEGSTKNTFRVPYYNTDFIKSNPNLESLAADPYRSVKYHNIIVGEHDHGKELEVSQSVAEVQESTYWMFPATGPDKKKIRQGIKDEDDYYDGLDEFLDVKVNKPKAGPGNLQLSAKYHLIVHGGKQRKNNYVDKDETIEYDPVDTLTSLKMWITPGSSKAKIRGRYATRPYLESGEAIDTESYPNYKKLPMMVYIGRKVNI